MEDKSWYNNLPQQAQYIFDLIVKYHSYFCDKDKKYRILVRTIKIVVLFFAMVNTIALGLKEILLPNVQITIGLVFSALLTFITAVSAYFNFEEYWMRNISIHIKLNVLRDNFIFDAKSGNMTQDKIEEYRKELERIQSDNISYWKKAIKRI